MSRVRRRRDARNSASSAGDFRRDERGSRGESNGGLLAKLCRARVAVRIARRSSVRSPGRSALIVALIALPVAGMAAVTLIIPSTIGTTAEKLTVQLGHTQARVQVVSAPDPNLSQEPSGMAWGGGSPVSSTPVAERRQLTSLFPSGTRMIPLLSTSVTVKTSTGVAALNATEGQAWDPALAGRYAVAAGHAPTDTGEVMVTASTLNRLGIGIGGTAQIIAPVPRTVTIVGLIDSRSEPASNQGFFGVPSTFTGHTAIEQDSQTVVYLPDTVLDWTQVQALNKQGAVALSRHVLEHPPAPGSDSMTGGSGSSLAIAFMLASMVFGFALLEVTLLAGAAFTVGARAQERSLATIASVGSTRSTIFSIITANGLVLGAIGGVVGVAAGIGAGSLFMRLTDDGSATQYWGYHFWWPAMIAIALFAIVIGWLGALVPAIRASKFDVVAALRGARRPALPSRRRPIVGVVVVLLGVALALAGGVLAIVLTQHGLYDARSPLFWAMVGMLLGGPILAQLGLLLCSGLLLRLLARLLSHAGVAARLASRDAARNPGRSVPALAVIMTTVFVAVFAMTMMTSSEVTARANYHYSTMLGQVQLPLQYWDQQTNALKAFPQPDQFASALTTTLDVGTVRTLKRVPDPQSWGSPNVQLGADPNSLVPSLVIPAANQCPSEPRSLNFDRATQVRGSDAQRKAQADWRCQSDFVLWGGDGHIWVGNADDLALVLGATPSQAAKDALSSGAAVSLYPEYVADGTLTISWWTAKYWADPQSVFDHIPADQSKSIPAVVEKPAHPLPFGIFISPSTADTLGLHYADATVLASTKTPPTTAQVDALNQAVDNTLIGNPGSFVAWVERGPANMAGAFSWGILGLSGLIAIGAAAVAIGLARSDGRRDQATLAEIGSSSRVTRDFGFWQAVVLAGMGAVLGAAVGLVPAIALALPGSGTIFSAPWPTIIATATLMPLAIACGTWLLATSRKIHPRRAAIE
jgi:putative ABC transport system permease protein